MYSAKALTIYVRYPWIARIIISFPPIYFVLKYNKTTNLTLLKLLLSRLNSIRV